MNNTSKYWIIAVVSIIAILFMYSLSFLSLKKNNQISRDLFDDYYSHVDYSLKGKIISKELIFDYGSKYKDLYLLTIRVDSFNVIKNDLSVGDPFLGIYDKSSNTAYVPSPIYSYDDCDSLPNIEISTQTKRVKFSNGIELGLSISQGLPQLDEKESPTTVRF